MNKEIKIGRIQTYNLFRMFLPKRFDVDNKDYSVRIEKYS